MSRDSRAFAQNLRVDAANLEDMARDLRQRADEVEGISADCAVAREAERAEIIRESMIGRAHFAWRDGLGYSQMPDAQRLALLGMLNAIRGCQSCGADIRARADSLEEALIPDACPFVIVGVH